MFMCSIPRSNLLPYPVSQSGDVSILVKVKTQTKRLNTVYVGPDTKYGQSWRLWHIFNFGTVARRHKDGSSTGIMPAKRSAERAIRMATPTVINTIKTEFEKEIHKYAKKLGYDTKGY